MTILQTVVLGLLAGSIYGLFSVGLSLAFGVMRIVNFAYGDFVMLGLYAAYEFTKHTGYSVYLVLPAVVIGALLLGAAVYFIFFRGTEATERSHDQLLIALGLSIFLQAAAVDIFGSEPRTIAGNSGSVALGGISLPWPQIIAFIIAVALVAAIEFILNRTGTGRALRAIVADRQMAIMVGVRIHRVFPAAFAASIALAGIAGVILYSYFPASPDVGQTFILIAFVCVIVGGAGDTRGAFLAGLLVGVAESLTATFWRPELQETVVYFLFIVAVMLKPNGILGRANV